MKTETYKIEGDECYEGRYKVMRYNLDTNEITNVPNYQAAIDNIEHLKTLRWLDNK